MDPVEEVELHYSMLEYLFTHRRLAESCFRYAWDDFLRENEKYKEMTTKQLKTIFWTEIANNIGQYELLTDAQKEYFDPDYFCVETTKGNKTLSVLENNEPKAGFDYTFSTTATAYQGTHNETQFPHEDATIVEKMKAIQELFKKPTICSNVFGEAAVGSKENEIEENSRINIIAQQPMNDIVDMGEHPIEIFKEILLTNEERASGKTTLSEDEVLERLADPDFGIDFADGLKQLMFNKFETNLCLDDEVSTYDFSKEAVTAAAEEQMKPPSQTTKKAAKQRSPFGARATTSTPLLYRSPIKTRNSIDISSIEGRRRSFLETIQRIRSPKTRRRIELTISKSESHIGEKSSEKK